MHGSWHSQECTQVYSRAALGDDMQHMGVQHLTAAGYALLPSIHVPCNQPCIPWEPADGGAAVQPDERHIEQLSAFVPSRVYHIPGGWVLDAAVGP
jgi:hypothetical protein